MMRNRKRAKQRIIENLTKEGEQASQDEDQIAGTSHKMGTSNNIVNEEEQINEIP